MNFAFYTDLLSFRQDKDHQPTTTKITLPMSPSMPRSIYSMAMIAPERLSHHVIPVITFKAKGMKQDVRIKVFEHEFHVHSVVLKLYSGYFRALLEATDSTMGSAPEGFSYDFVSVFDAAGGWGLEAVRRNNTSTPPQTPAQPPGTISLTEGLKTEHDEIAFEKLLCAMYSKPYSITGFQELSDMTRLAEFYLALPVFSHSLYTALWQSQGLVDDIPENCKSTLILAQKLRHPLLFREALVHVVCTWKGYSRFLDGHYSLVCCVTMAYNRVCERLLDANQEIFLMMNGPGRDDLIDATAILDRSATPTQNAHFYRHLYNLWEENLNGAFTNANNALKALLENELVLERRCTVAGEGEYRHGLLCAWIEDRELPWSLLDDDW